MTSNGQPTLRNRVRALTSEALVDAAERVMIRRGYERATMHEMAAAAGCATGTFYLYFANKQVLFERIVARHADRMFTAAVAERAGHRRAVDKLRAGLQAILRYAHQHRPFFRLLFTAMPMRRRTMRPLLSAATLRHHERFRDSDLQLLREAQRSGSVRADLPPEILVDFLNDVGMGMMEQFTFAPHRPGLDEQVRIVWGLMSGGLAAGSVDEPG